MSKKNLENDVLFELNGLTVLKNHLYTVQHRVDMDAPSGFVEFGATKLPSDGVGDTFYCPYKNQGQGRGIWDSGFYTTDPTYVGFEKDEVKIITEGLMQNVVEPYRQAAGEPTAFAPDNKDSFEFTAFRVWEGRVYRTEDPIDVMELYFALKTRHIVTRENAGDATFDNAAYMITDIAKDVKKKDRDAVDKFTAIGTFVALLKSDRNTLHSLMKYQGLDLPEDIADEAFQGLFARYIEKPANLQSFNLTLRELDTKKGKEKIELFSILKDKTKNPKGKFSRENGKIYYDNTELGSDLKNAAERLVKDTNLLDIKKELLFADED